MTIKLSETEIKDVIKTALCNSMNELGGYGFEWDKNAMNYSKYRFEGACLEDVIIKALEGGEGFFVIDVEGGDDEVSSFTLNTAIETFNTNDNSDFHDAILNILKETDDAIDGDIILQTLLFGEVVYG